jgi:hypothetical protein
VELDTEEDFLSCAQREKETLPNFYWRFLQLKAKAPEVSDDQVIVHALKALHVGPLHSHLAREWPKTVSGLCMSSSSNSASLTFNIFVSSSSRGKCRSSMKLQDLATTKINEATPN